MKSTSKRFLEQRLLRTMTAASLVFALIGGSLLYIYGYSQEQKRGRHTLDSLAATVRSSAQIAVFVQNDVIAEDVTQGLLRSEAILAVALESGEGYRFVGWDDGGPRDWSMRDEVDYALFSPTAPELRVGTLRILTDSGLLEQRARESALRQILLLIAQMLALALIGVIAFRRLVVQPLSLLIGQLKRVGPGSGERFSIPAGHDNSEIGMLAGELNRYLDTSEAAIASERELRERVESIEAHYRRIFESASVGVMVLGLDGCLINCNPVMRERIDRLGASTDGDQFERLFKRPDKARKLVEQACRGGDVAAADLELVGNTAQWVHCLLSVSRGEDGEFAFIEVVLYDVTSRREREEEAMRTAERDPLTDLVNRRGAESYIDRAIDEAHRNRTGLTLLYVDLDEFKPVNDTHGHAIGDGVLIEAAARLKGIQRRSSDLVARLGGDEFVIAAYDCHKHDDAVKSLAMAVVDAMSRPFALPDGSSVVVGASVGVAGYPEDGVHRAELMFAADQAMYAAKQAGRDRYVLAGSPPASGR